MRYRIIAAALVATAISLMTGAPADAASGLRLSKVYYDSPGSDSGSNRSVNAEWFSVTNHGSRARLLAGWTVRDRGGHVYYFPPTFRLGAGKTVVVHTGKGVSVGRNLYWGEDDYVWNNSGDRAILDTSSGSRVDVCSWSRIGNGQTSC
jgi:hypothetical protein